MLDKLDEGILGLLRINARMPVSAIAQELKTSRSTVQDRLRKLEERGTIKGYSVNLSDAVNSNKIKAYTSISNEPQKSSIIVAELKAIRQVNSIYSVSGKYDLMVETETENPTEMDAVLDKLAEIPGVLRTETSLVLSTRLQR